ncbi:hypothetical protein MYAM1_001255 [Malassezia yamatoensis]|uniref:Vacuolar sorting protein Vps3844 C-terminal domain-containing protein n=1 Tax=Malassezia yamatoensis TaxID=253288 RepID=A0AAJ5YVT5_9BASI|nr:hypothetical protein MYAM1_001255 [Malassezia yamatoensis]
MLSLWYALAFVAAPAAVLAQLTTIYLPSGIVSTARPVKINLPEAHQVLSHHLGVDDQVLKAPKSDSEAIWHHLPNDAAKYDSSDLFKPNSGLVLTFEGLEDEADLFGENLFATHTISHTKDASFDALARLYAKVTGGMQHLVHNSGDALSKWKNQLATLSDLANDDTKLSLNAVDQIRLDSLKAVREEYGADSSVFNDAKLQLKAVVDRLAEKMTHISLPFAVVHTPINDPSQHTRRSQEGFDAGIAPFIAPAHRIGGPMPRLNVTLGKTNACYKQARDLEWATAKCSGHGFPIESSKGGQKCWRCQCTPTKTKQRTINWAGNACEKQDKSELTLLVIGTVALLFVSTAGTIALLYNEGKNALPGTLSSVSLSS